MFEGKSSVSVASGANGANMQFYNTKSALTDAPTAPQGRVTEAHESTRRLLEHLHHEISSLESRLTTVLRPATPQGNSVGEKARSEPSQLGMSIESANEQLHGLLIYVQSLAARVDL